MAADAEIEESVDHRLIEAGVLEDRAYQTALVGAAEAEHTLVCLPTGLGKTTVSLRVTARRLADAGVDPADVAAAPDAKALLLAPTKPLVEQHAAFYREALSVPDDKIVVFTGEVRPDDRAELWDGARVVVATPQVVENDLVGSRLSLRDVVHVTFDECHRATGEYAYTYIAERYHDEAEAPLVTAMSASPGDDEETIRRVCENLGVKRVEVKTDDDPDVDPYTYETTVEWERVELPEEVTEIRDKIAGVIEERLTRLKEMGVTRSTDPEMSQSDLNTVRRKLQALIDEGDSKGYQGMSVHAEVMKLRRALELVETQSVESLRRYFERQRNAAAASGASKASQRLVSEPEIQAAMELAEAYDGLHPKFRQARILLAETLGVAGGDRVIVFTETRDTAETLTEFLGEHFPTRRFVGQGDKEGSEGMTQTEQQETLDAFRAGKFEVLVSTSVAEEGLDVPEVDLVLFFEPVPTAVRAIQRRGRTGRQTEGRVVGLIAEDTRDEAFYWVSKRRETEMREELESLRAIADELTEDLGGQVSLDAFADSENEDGRSGGGEEEPAPRSESANGDPAADDDDGSDQTGLSAFAAPAPDDVDGDSVEAPERVEADPDGDTEVVVDQRELDSAIARDLSTREAVTTRLETLEVGDYVLSDRVVVERKTTADFLDSLLGGDRSVFEQVGAAARHYERPVVVVEGDGLYEERNVRPAAIHGAIASLAVDFGASVLRTGDTEETADLLASIARREQESRDREVSAHGEKAQKTLAEQQEYVVSSMADVGPVTAKRLLAGLGSVEGVLTADRERLQEVEGVGEVTADRVREVATADYEP
jgi:Fanconi anemia group M protein